MKPDNEDNHSQNLAIYTQKILKESSYNYLQQLQVEAKKAAKFKAEIAKSVEERLNFIGSTIPATWLENPPELNTLDNQNNSNHYQVTYNQQQEHNHYYSQQQPTPKGKTTKEKKNKSAGNSVFLMLAIAVKKLGLCDPKDERKGKQADAVRFFQKQLEKEGLTGQYLKESTLKGNLKTAMDALREHAVLDKKDDT